MKRESFGWQIYSGIKPQEHEKVFTKTFNSAFKDTNLKAYLEEKNINTLILVGMQTEYCIDKTATVAFEYGYKNIFPFKTNTTYDRKIQTITKT